MNEPRAHPTPRRDGPAARSDSLADVLERVLDKGIVIAGDIRIDLLDIELLTIRIRLLISSADKAQELGMAWWQGDPFYTGGLPTGDTDESPDTRALQRLVDGTEELSRRVARLEDGNGSRSGAREDPDGSDRP